jgi:hypothetical protein
MLGGVLLALSARADEAVYIVTFPVPRATATAASASADGIGGRLGPAARAARRGVVQAAIDGAAPLGAGSVNVSQHFDVLDGFAGSLSTEALAYFASIGATVELDQEVRADAARVRGRFRAAAARRAPPD